MLELLNRKNYLSATEFSLELSKLIIPPASQYYSSMSAELWLGAELSWGCSRGILIWGCTDQPEGGLEEED